MAVLAVTRGAVNASAERLLVLVWPPEAEIDVGGRGARVPGRIEPLSIRPRRR